VQGGCDLKTLSRKERVSRAIRHESLDFFPSQVDFTPRDIPRIAEAFGVPPIELDAAVDNHLVYAYSLGNAEEYMHTPSVLEKALALGLVKLDEPNGLVYDTWGVGWDLHSEGVQVSHHPLANPDAVGKYTFPDPAAPGLMDHARDVVARYRGDYFVVAFQHISLFERSWTLRGFENLMLDIAGENQALDSFLDAITEYQIGVARRFVDIGVDGVRIGDDYGSQLGLLMSPDAWRRYIKPRLRKIYSVYQASGLPVIQHSCGDIRSILPDFVDMGLNVLHPLQPKAMPHRDVVDACGGKICFFGGIDTQELLPFGTPQDVRGSVLRCIEILGQSGGYIIAPSQEVMSDVPTENVRALIAAIKEFRDRVPKRTLG
jgi:uroporphyrinogen decarboxylase